MSICISPHMPDEKLKSLGLLLLQDKEWNLLSLQDMYNAGNSLEDISEVIPFRNNKCTRSKRCCGQCTRKCNFRCIQDCLNRLYMWRKLVETTPERDRDKLPLGIRLIVTQQFETLEDLSYCVGEIISRNTNAALNEYMTEANMLTSENPYKLDYSPRYDTNPKTGKRIVDLHTGLYKILEWPKSGLCPYCLPKSSMDRRIKVR